MAKGITSGGRKLNYSAYLDITETLKKQEKLKRGFDDIAAAAKRAGNGQIDPKPLTTYQAEQLKIKQQAIDLAKQKQEQAKAEKAASLVLQDALKQERLAREAINTQIAANRLAQQQANQVAKEQAEIQKQIANQKRPTQVSNSAAEIAKYNAGTLGTNGQVNTAFTTYLREVKKDFDAGKISAKEYVAELERYSAATLASNSVTRTQVTATQAATKSKQELAQIEAINTFRVNENNAARKVAAKEAINEKGSIEQRKAALERLLGVYARLNSEERNTSYGTRMANTIAQLRVQIKGIEDQTKKMASSSVTSIDQYKASLQRLLAAYTALSKEQRDTVAGAKLAEMIRNLRDQIKGLEDDTKSSKKGIAAVFEYLKDNITSALGAIALLTAAWSAAKSVFSHNVEISDNFTDVQRTAKLSKEEVSEFGKELKKLDTRTDLEHLLDVGFIGGRLSVPKQDLEDFVKQVDELAVVLKKEFPGGAEAVAESLGKIVTIYKITETEGVSLGTALSKVGSTLLELAHSGPVTVKYLQDFTLGVAGTAASAKLSVPVISAYGAVLGESGQIASSAALAITRLVAGLTTKTAKYAAIAQLGDATLTVEKFTKIVNTDTKQALDLFFKGLKAGNPVATEFDGRLGSVGINTGKIMNAVKILANNQDKLTDRIRVSSKAFEEGTSVAHNFGLANNNLAASVDKLKNSAVNLTTDPNSSLASFFKGIVDGSTYAIKAISDLDEALTRTQLEKDRKIVARADGKQSGKDFLSGLFFGGGAQSSKEIEEARARIRENNSRILNDEIAARGKASADLLANGKKEIEIRKLITGEVVKQKIANDRLANALAFVANPKNTGESVETVSKRINKLREAARQQSALVAQLRTKLPKNTEVYGDGSLINQEEEGRTPAIIEAEIKALKAVNKKLKVGSKELAEGVAKLKALKKELKLALGGTDTEGVKAENTALKAAEEFSSKITDLHNTSFSKQISTNEAEIQAIKDKYAKMKDEAVKYYSDPKNTGTAKINGKNVSASQVYATMRTDQEKEIAAARYAQGTEALKVSLEEQRQLYTDFEEYKEKFGIDKAKERYGKLIKTDRTYLDQLKIAYSIAIAQGYAGGFTPEVTARMSDLNKNIKLETEAEKKKHDELLFGLQAYAEKRKVLQEKMTKKVLEFEKAGNKGKAEEARKEYQRQLLDLGTSHVEQFESYKKFFEDVDGLTSTEMAKRLDTLKLDISKLDSPELKEFLNKILRAGQIQLNTKTIDGYRSIVSSLQEAAQASEGLSAGLSEGLNMAVKLGAVFVDIKASFDQFKQAKTDDNPLGMLTAGIAGVSSVLSIVNMVSGLFAKARAFKEENQKVINEFNNKRFFAEFDINQLYRERLRTQLELNSVTVSGLKMSTAELKKQLNENAADYKRISELLSQENYITGYKNTSGANLVVKQVAILESLAGKSYKDIEKLFMSGQLTDRAKELFTQLQKLQAEGVDIDKLIADNTKSIMDAATGTTADSIRDSIITGFENGYRTAKDFADDFQSLMSSATRQIFKEFIDNQELAAFYKQYADMAQNGPLTVDQKATLKDLYDAMIGRINGKYEELKGITGNDFLADNKNSTNNLKGSVAQQLTESTGTIIAGNLSAIQINSGKMVTLQTITNKSIGDIYTIAKSNFDVQLRIEANTYRTAENTTDIPAIKAALVSIDKKMGNSAAALTANGR